MDLKNKNRSKLVAELQTYKILTYLIIGILILLIAVSVYGLMTKEDNTTFFSLLVIIICLSFCIPFNYSIIKKIKKEVELRGKE